MAQPASGPGARGPLLLLDGMSLAFRAFYALPEELATTTGVVTNAVHGFANMLLYLVRDHEASGLAVAVDVGGGTFRDDLVEEYKGGRAATPDNLLPQFDMIRTLVESLAIPVVGVEGYEADDVLATLATEARDRSQPVIIVTGDRDSYQLVEDPFIQVLYNKRGVSDYALYDEAGIVDRTGVRPVDYPLLASLRGDQSDNLPGVPGVGEKTAAKLVNEYGTLDEILAHLDALSPKLRQNLAEYADRVRANNEVIPLVRTVPLDVHIDDLHLGGWDLDAARDTFAQFELRTVWNRFEEAMVQGRFGSPAGSDGAVAAPGAPAAAAPATAVDQDTGWLDGPRVVAAAAVAEAVTGLAEVVAAARAGTGSLAVVPRWTGDEGRSPLRSLTLTAEVAPGGAPAGTGGAKAKAKGKGAAAGAGLPLVLHLPGAAEGAPGGVEGTAVLDDPEVTKALAEAVGPDGVGVVGHDVKELMRWLLPAGVDITGLTMDTAVAAYLLDPSVDRYRLADLATAHLGVEVDDGAGPKGQGTFSLGDGALGDAVGGDPSAPDGEAVQVARLASVVARLRAPLEAALTANGLGAVHDEIDRPLVRVLAVMEVTGVPVDREVLRSIAADLVEECNSLEGTIHDLAGGPFNVNSVPQLREVLYDRLGLTPLRKTKTGYSTDARTLEQLRDQHPVVAALLRYREVEKLRSTYGESLAAEVADDGRIHATFRQTVARTGRLSSDRPNLHNIPVRTEEGRRFREAFVPSPGRTLLVADYDQVELRAIAHLSGDPGLGEAFAAGRDIHRTVASQVFGVEPEAVTLGQRSTAKMVSYGLAYGMEAFGLSQRLGVPVEEARVILDAYFDGFPAVRRYMEETVAEARWKGYTVTAFGRRRPLPDLVSTNFQVRQAAERQAMNAGIQGLAADLFKVALIRLDAGLEGRGLASDLVLQVHDEVMVDVAPGEEDEVGALTESAMTGAADLSVPLKVAMAWGSSWAAAKG